MMRAEAGDAAEAEASISLAGVALTADDLPAEYHVGFYDAVIIHSEADATAASNLRAILERFVLTAEGAPVKVGLVSDGVTLRTHMLEDLVARSLVYLVYLTDEFHGEAWAALQQTTVIWQSVAVASRRHSVIPLRTASCVRGETLLSLQIQGVNVSGLLREASGVTVRLADVDVATLFLDDLDGGTMAKLRRALLCDTAQKLREEEAWRAELREKIRYRKWEWLQKAEAGRKRKEAERQRSGAELRARLAARDDGGASEATGEGDGVARIVGTGEAKANCVYHIHAKYLQIGDANAMNIGVQDTHGCEDEDDSDFDGHSSNHDSSGSTSPNSDESQQSDGTEESQRATPQTISTGGRCSSDESCDLAERSISSEETQSLATPIGIVENQPASASLSSASFDVVCPTEKNRTINQSDEIRAVQSFTDSLGYGGGPLTAECNADRQAVDLKDSEVINDEQLNCTDENQSFRSDDSTPVMKPMLATEDVTCISEYLSNQSHSSNDTPVMKPILATEDVTCISEDLSNQSHSSNDTPVMKPMLAREEVTCRSEDLSMNQSYSQSDTPVMKPIGSTVFRRSDPSSAPLPGQENVLAMHENIALVPAGRTRTEVLPRCSASDVLPVVIASNVPSTFDASDVVALSCGTSTVPPVYTQVTYAYDRAPMHTRRTYSENVARIFNSAGTGGAAVVHCACSTAVPAPAPAPGTIDRLLKRLRHLHSANSVDKIELASEVTE